MKHLTDSVKKSLETSNWYSAIAISLAIPDICVKITDGTKTTGKKYAKWFDNYVGENYKTNYSSNQLEMTKKYASIEEYERLLKGTRLSGNDCYALRCAFLHEGSGEINSQSAREILDEIKFLEPNYQMNVHGSIINNKLVLHTDEFCLHILQGVENWQKELTEEQKERLYTFLKVKNVFGFINEKIE
ncbi:hypothetical protein ACFSX9_04235 [Flavobacterium ardleyense]|uniref:Uncharacterized protein n=1 Tax=Flavobacterium ardleyense TaxID=2038737 RepID=A0ABW5Z6L5_9FLAO